MYTIPSFFCEAYQGPITIRLRIHPLVPVPKFGLHPVHSFKGANESQLPLEESPCRISNGIFQVYPMDLQTADGAFHDHLESSIQDKTL